MEVIFRVYRLAGAFYGLGADGYYFSDYDFTLAREITENYKTIEEAEQYIETTLKELKSRGIKESFVILKTYQLAK